MLEEILRLTKENNRLLHKLRRGALWGRLFTIVFYLAILIAPVWFYLAYFKGTVENALQVYEKIQSGGVQAQDQFQAIQDIIKQFQSKIPSGNSSSTRQ